MVSLYFSTKSGNFGNSVGADRKHGPWKMEIRTAKVKYAPQEAKYDSGQKKAAVAGCLSFISIKLSQPATGHGPL